ncbi:1-aminocyclopropane-1-carboxylate oxidase like protein [Quercus suber]|uniref:1-aminocyclopropane-1-carboxylate oxidase like protein n=1 Tax=Quercus suber TaxID=58331 RepID=A0AAW0LXR0_QUESU
MFVFGDAFIAITEPARGGRARRELAQGKGVAGYRQSPISISIRLPPALAWNSLLVFENLLQEIQELKLDYDRDKEVKEFDETKAGINGLVDSGVTKVPSFLIDPPESLPNPMLSPATTQFEVPVIDPKALNKIVDEVRKASETWVSFWTKCLIAVREFHDQPRKRRWSGTHVISCKKARRDSMHLISKMVPKP